MGWTGLVTGNYAAGTAAGGSRRRGAMGVAVAGREAAAAGSRRRGRRVDRRHCEVDAGTKVSNR